MRCGRVERKAAPAVAALLVIQLGGCRRCAAGYSETFMKTLIASIFALALMGSGVANAAIIGAHVGPLGVGIGVGHHHHVHCVYHHHHRICR
jgi:hypothetical protein